MTQASFSLTTRRGDLLSHVPSPIGAAAAFGAGIAGDVARGVLLALTGLGIVLAVTAATLTLSAWQAAVPPVVPPQQIQYR